MGLVLIAVAVALAFANGANDNFKGVATLFGSGTTGYRRALAWATATTLAGSVAALFLAGRLLTAFTGKGLVPDSIAVEPTFAAAVALGAGMTVLLATRIGMPVSTTHALVGALVGSAWASGAAPDWSQLGGRFVLPLLLSPVLAVVVTLGLYPVFRRLRCALGVTERTCFCVGTEVVETVPALSPDMALERVAHLSARMGDPVTCRRIYSGRVFGTDASSVLDRAHFVSAGMVGFARGLNDTPKIAALLLLAPFVDGRSALIVVGAMIALGGWSSARRVAETMSHRVTEMNHGQGFTANLVTGIIVIGASRLGLPVSTTHVSCGALFGIGAVTGQGHWRMIATILLAWVITLPVAAACALTAYATLQLSFG